jgi:hypothetical protein
MRLRAFTQLRMSAGTGVSTLERVTRQTVIRPGRPETGLGGTVDR